ncbi:MAG: RemK protein [Candidatus Hydrogenedentota bacterium]
MVAMRAIIYASVFISLLMLYLPLAIALRDPNAVSLGVFRYAAFILYIAGAAIGLWCVVGFIRYGRGTPAPFDPPRKLVVRGLYRWVRNPMYVGGFLFTLGHVVWFGSIRVAAYLACMSVAAIMFVVLYEEPVLKQMFGEEYERYRRNVPRWIPRWSRSERRSGNGAA